VIKPLENKTHRTASLGLNQNKELPYAIIFFTLASILTFFLARQGTNPILVFFIGEIIIGLFFIDFLRMKILMHVYQVMLVYFYFSLVVFHSFNDTSREFYYSAYFVSVLHGLFVVVGYHLISAKKVVRPMAPNQSILSLGYILYGFFMGLYALLNYNSSLDYSHQWLTYDESQALPIYKIYISIIYNYFIKFVIYLTSHPIITATFSILGNLISYPMSGVKGPMVASFICFFVVMQVYLYRISVKGLLVFGILGGGLIFLLIGSTAFRGDLSIQSLIYTLSNVEVLTNRWVYFVMESPESSHIRYTADIMRMIENGVTDFRYGFDHYRFFLYPFKDLISGWELSTYNQYPVLLAGRNVSAGLYIGLGGELFWNFGWFFPLVSLGYGVSLRWVTNYAFSGNFLAFVVYLMMVHSLVWHLYRGETNAFIITVTGFSSALIILKLILKVRQIRLLSSPITKFVFKRTVKRSMDLE
jgi:hypothetical protein